MTFQFGGAQHIGARRYQQDAFTTVLSGGTLLAVVADGMGGMRFGDRASKTAVEGFAESWKRRQGDDAPGALLRAVESANAAVLKTAQGLDAVEQMGTTLIAVSAGEEGLHWVSVGDSGIFHLRGGTLRQLNRMHTYGVELDAQVAEGRIPKEVADLHPERDALTSFIGIEGLTLIDRSITPLVLQAGDVVVLASDGLYRTLTPEQIVQVAAEQEAECVAEALIAEAIACEIPYQDNVTAVVIGVGADRAPGRIRGRLSSWLKGKK